MALKCRVVEKDEQLDNSTLTLGFPDEKGQVVKLAGIALADMDSVEEGGYYEIDFKASAAPASDPTPADNGQSSAPTDA